MRAIRAAVCCAAGLLLTACSNPAESPKGSDHRALIIVDMQNDFMPGGALPASGGDEIVPLINQLQEKFSLIVATQDWHPQGHGSFASSHPGNAPGEVIDLNGLDQVLWPDHAVQGSVGADFAADLEKAKIARVVQKGTNPKVDSYSGFYDNGQRGDTGLKDYLKKQGVTDVYVVGLALDYCVKFTALDAQRIGFNTTVIVDASRPVDASTGARALENLKAAGVQLVPAVDVLTSAD